MTSAGGPAVAAESLTKRFQSGWMRRRVVTALEDLTLRVERGEVFGLLGPNGSGKTTTIKLLLGFLFPTSVRAELLGRPAGDPVAKARLGFLPEESYLHPFLTAEETLDFHAGLFGIPAATRRERTAVLLDRVAILHCGRMVETGRVKDLLTLSEETWIRAKGASGEELSRAAALLPGARLEHPTETLEAHFLKVIRSQGPTP